MGGLASIPDLTFGSVTLRPSIREFECRTRRLTLEPRVMQVLIALVEADGAVVSRDDLIQRCWQGRVVSEDAINRCIGQLRRLAKSGDEPCFTIECIPRVGYRLLPRPSAAEPHSARNQKGGGQSVSGPLWPGRPVPAVLYGMLLVQQSVCLLAYGGHNSDGVPIPWAIQYSGPLLALIGLALSIVSWFRRSGQHRAHLPNGDARI
ncbi:MAG: winged helix-turn-helix domain-containing protein [Alphaproteobacteria bacterium]|nr:winged helix-turn-helix domain-containing protein [Alphaproteobacteria bacterium]